MFTKTKAAILTTLCLSVSARADTFLNATAGDQNMVDYVKTAGAKI